MPRLRTHTCRFCLSVYSFLPSLVHRDPLSFLPPGAEFASAAMPQQMLPGLLIIAGAMGASGGLLYSLNWLFTGHAVSIILVIRVANLKSHSCLCRLQKKNIGRDEWDYLMEQRDARLKAAK